MIGFWVCFEMANDHLEVEICLSRVKKNWAIGIRGCWEGESGLVNVLVEIQIFDILVVGLLLTIQS
jgi:hypothetical protein